MNTITPGEQSPSPGDRSVMKNRKRANLDEEVFERQVLICKAFANSTRLHILDLLGRRDWGAGELEKKLGISKANLSQHITVLKTAGVIVRRRCGKNVYFSLAMPEVKRACELIRGVLRAQVRNDRRFVI